MLIAVDTGGTKTLVSLFDNGGSLRQKDLFATPKSQEEYVSLLKSKLRAYQGTDIDAVVIALPGIVKEGVALWCNNLEWKNFRAAEAFQGILGTSPVLIENDANLAGLAEAKSLQPTPVAVLYVTISTGIGTGIITNGHIDPGLRYSEGGRTLVEFEGTIQEWESFASGKAIHKVYGKYARDIRDPQTWQQIADRISRGFLATIPILQPDVVIIGGSIGTYFDRYSTQLHSILSDKLPPHIPCPRFIQASHPEEAVIYGCYYYALENLASHPLS